MSGKLDIVFQREIGGGKQIIFKHFSKSNKCEMKFLAFVPESVAYEEKFNCLFFLPGACCNEQNFLNRSEFQQHAAEHRFVVISPDTSPRVELPGDTTDKYCGRGASWYIDCTQEPFVQHYQMYTYVSSELYDIVLKKFPVYPKFGISGHSMGGCGAICIGLRNPEKFVSISLFAANINPILWGSESIYRRLLGEDEELWKLYDGYEVTKHYSGPRREILQDQGISDEVKTLHPERLPEAVAENPKGNQVIKLTYRRLEGDHSWEFLKKLWKEHFEFHKRVMFFEAQGV